MVANGTVGSGADDVLLGLVLLLLRVVVVVGLRVQGGLRCVHTIDVHDAVLVQNCLEHCMTQRESCQSLKSTTARCALGRRDFGRGSSRTSEDRML